MSAPPLPWLSDAEIDDMCAGLTRNSAKLRYLQDELKLPVKANPVLFNGRTTLLTNAGSVDDPVAPSRQYCPSDLQQGSRVEPASHLMVKTREQRGDFALRAPCSVFRSPCPPTAGCVRVANAVSQWRFSDTH